MTDQGAIYQTLFDRLPIGLFRISAEGEVLRVNAALVKMLGYPEENVILGRRIRPFFAHSADLDAAITRIRENGHVDDYETRMVREDGSSLWVRLNARLVVPKEDGDSYIEGAVEDIEHERQVSEALVESDQFIKNIIESVAEGITVYNLEMRCVLWNGAMEKLTGIHPTDAIAQPPGKTFSSLPDSELQSILERTLNGELVGLEDLEIGQHWVSVVFSPYRSARGEITGVVATLHETTARRQAEKERENLLASEREQRQRAEALGRVSQALNAVLDLPRLLELICRESSELLRVDAALVWLVDRKSKARGVIENIAGYGWEADRFAGSQIRIDDMNNFAGRVIRERIPICLNEVTEATHTGLSGVFRVHSILGVPLFHGDEVIGVLQLIDNHKMNRFGEAEIEIATQLGSHAANAVNNAQLYDRLIEANREMEKAYVSTLEGWARALELRDAQTEGHSSRVTQMTLKLARHLGVDEEALENIRQGALLHDIGKMGVPDSILEKPGPLTPEEWNVMRRHPSYALSMLSPIDHLQQAIEIPYCHHERWDGSGYPRGLRGEEIPLAARIFAVVDVFDALTNDRPYRKAWPRDIALAYIQAEAGTLFDPQIVNAFVDLI